MQWFLTADCENRLVSLLQLWKAALCTLSLGNPIRSHCFKFIFILATRVYIFSWFSDLHSYLILPLSYVITPERNLCPSLCSFLSISYFPKMPPIILPVASEKKRPFFLTFPFLVYQSCQMLSHSSTSTALVQDTMVYTWLTSVVS